MQWAEEAEEPETQRIGIPDGDFPNIATGIRMGAGLCRVQADDVPQEAQGGGCHGRRVDADAVGGRRGRADVDGLLKEAVVALAMEGIEAVRDRQRSQDGDEEA